ncbi:MAG: phycocyanobilin:ferredoxin oxidoreductase [Synechococcus sp.]|nr:phycocyanobilin:ferredoxin oxidoreductase [Synechococcus sp.]
MIQGSPRGDAPAADEGQPRGPARPAEAAPPAAATPPGEAAPPAEAARPAVGGLPATPAAARGSGGIHPLVDALAERIRACRAALPGLEPLAIAPDLEAISGSLDGDELFIRNEVHRSHGLRKLHLETARLGAGLQILHCVFFPDPRCDLPVFGADIVAGRGGVSAAIVDLSPVLETGLPPGIRVALQQRSRPAFAQVRELPPWGAIFSPEVLFVRPDGPREEAWFVDEVAAFLRVLAQAAAQAELQPADAVATVARWHGQLRYCRQQKQNDKTRRVLEKAFDPHWANRYIEELLFDDPPAPC